MSVLVARMHPFPEGLQLRLLLVPCMQKPHCSSASVLITGSTHKAFGLLQVTHEFRVQMLEIYNENLRDLLVDGRSNLPNKLEILATQSSGCNVPGAIQIDVSDAADVANLMAKGASQRATCETKMNDRSSRSHQILTVIVDGINHVTGARSHGCLHLIDLAGSERVSKSEASGNSPGSGAGLRCGCEIGSYWQHVCPRDSARP